MQDEPEAGREPVLTAYRRGAWAEVERGARLILARRPDDGFGLHMLADAQLRLGRLDRALESYDHLVALGAPPPPALLGRADTLGALGRHEEAEAAYSRYLALDPGSARAWRNLANSRLAAGRPEAALEALDRALSLRPDYPEALFARATTLDALHRGAEALAAFDDLDKRLPGNDQVRYGRAIAALRAGRLAEGWPALSLRWKMEGAGDPRRYPKPLWLGETPLAGKRLLIHQEQGFGDLIHLARYAPMAAAAGATVYIQARAPAKPLLETLTGVSGVFAPGEVLPDIDLQIPVFSLPQAFATTLETIPAGVPYLFADPERRRTWNERLGDHGRPRIGLAWAGNPEQVNDHSRSMPLSALLPALTDRHDFISLQMDLNPVDAAVLAATPLIREPGAALKDFADTAAIIDTCDLVISVCTSAAHLAGAMGKPVWILLCHTPDFRWLSHRSDSPWYPTARLFRQPAPGDWEAVAGEVKRALDTGL